MSWHHDEVTKKRIAEGRRAYFARMSGEEHVEFCEKISVGVRATASTMSQEERNEKFGHGEVSARFYEEHPDVARQIGEAVSDSWKNMSMDERKCRAANMSKGLRNSTLVEASRTDDWRERISETSKLFWTDEKKREQSERALKQWLEGRWGDKKLGVYTYRDYPSNWDFIRLVIIERDGHSCRLCLSTDGLHVHHVNYEPSDCRWENLLTLCVSCHTRTNFDRDYWQRYLTTLVEGEVRSWQS